jgi:hypothetical protein
MASAAIESISAVTLASRQLSQSNRPTCRAAVDLGEGAAPRPASGSQHPVSVRARIIGPVLRLLPPPCRPFHPFRSERLVSVAVTRLATGRRYLLGCADEARTFLAHGATAQKSDAQYYVGRGGILFNCERLFGAFSRFIACPRQELKQLRSRSGTDISPIPPA